MYQFSTSIRAAGACLILMAGFAQAVRADEPKAPTGQELAFDNRKGNCLACHAMPGESKAVTSTNIAPPLISMKERFPERAKLYAQVWDASKANADTLMPPFGKHKILSDDEINKVVDYIYGL
ncbi:MAG: sulfur oxidation c-type cytochrome SoxX [Thiobacillus sp. 65-1059]|nr:MAG: sulfur oxidation c-type cytochrome SoxX [Thiobacillus sp. 65-1059]